MRDIGPQPRPHTLAKLDGRRKEAKLLEAVRHDLTEHVGGHPSATQRALIDRASWLSLHVALMDAKTIETGVPSERDGNAYLALTDSLTRTLRELGLKDGGPGPGPTFDISSVVTTPRPVEGEKYADRRNY